MIKFEDYIIIKYKLKFQVFQNDKLTCIFEENNTGLNLIEVKQRIDLTELKKLFKYLNENFCK
jgi:hypothetical protein